MGKTKRIYFETEEVTTVKRKGWIDVDVDYTQFYHCVFKYTKDLNSKYALKYLLWIITKADKMNMIPHNAKVIDEFIEQFEVKPSVGTVRNSISELVSAGILLKHSINSYQLNPKILWGDEVSSRIEHIKGLNGDTLSKLDDYELVES